MIGESHLTQKEDKFMQASYGEPLISPNPKWSATRTESGNVVSILYDDFIANVNGAAKIFSKTSSIAIKKRNNKSIITIKGAVNIVSGGICWLEVFVNNKKTEILYTSNKAIELKIQSSASEFIRMSITVICQTNELKNNAAALIQIDSVDFS